MKNQNYPTEHRNEQLKNMFENLGFDVKLIGDRNQPKIIMNDDYVISGFVQNRLYHFTSKPFGGEKVRTVNLNEPDITKKEIEDILECYLQRNFFRLKSENDMFYVRTDKNIPLFSNLDSRYFFDKERMMDTKSYLENVFNIKTTIVESKNKYTE